MPLLGRPSALGPGGRWRTRRGFAGGLAVASSLGLVVRLVGLTQESLWLDEGFTLDSIQRRSVASVIGRCMDDVHPPLSYLLLHLWTRLLGDSDAALRALPALFGAATVPVAGVLCARWAGRRVGVAGALLVALSPLLVRVAQDARPYPLLGLLATAASERWLAARARPSRGRFVAWGLLLVAALYTHVLATGVAALHLLWAFAGARGGGPRDRAMRRATIRGLALVALCFVPWGLVVLENQATFRGYGRLTSVFDGLADVIGTKTAAVALTALAAVGLLDHRRRRGRWPRGVGPGLASAAVLIGVPLLGTWWVRPMMAPRLLAHAVPFLAVPLAAGGLALARRGRAAAVGVAVVALVALGLGHVRRVVRVDREQWREAAAHVQTRLGDGDAVYAEGTAAYALLRHYLPAARTRQVQRKALGVEDARRVFLVSSSHDRAREARRERLRAEGRRETDWARFVGMEVSTWER